MEPPIYNPIIPHNGYLSGGFRPGRMIRIQGNVLPHAKRFAINLMCGPNPSQDDIALQVNPRFNENVVVRNSRIQLGWGQDEKLGHLPLNRGQNFEIIILCEPHQYKIAINGLHFTEFRARLPVERVSHVAIDGEVTVSVIYFEGATIANEPPVMSMPQPMAAQGQESIGWQPMGAPMPNYQATPQYYSPPQGQGMYQSPGQGQPKEKSGGLMDKGGKLVAGGLQKVGLGSYANKIPGTSKNSQADPSHSQVQGAYGGYVAPTPGAVGPPGSSSYEAEKKLKKKKQKDKAIKYGVPIAGAALGAFAIKKILD